MKKIFTLIFSLGLLTAAFAQERHHHQDYNSNNGSVDQPWYNGDQPKYGNDQRFQDQPYSNSDNWGYQSNDRREDHRYDNEVSGRYGFGRTDGWREGFGQRRFNERRFYKRMRHRHSEAYWTRPGLQVFFGLR